MKIIWGIILLTAVAFAQKPELLLLETYSDQNTSGWVMSEKLDGIRAYWDGERMLSRQGYEINAPQWFTKGYPDFAIDGELWSGRGEFETVSSIVRDTVPGEGWRRVKHHIFDVPEAKGDLLQRLAMLEACKSPYIQVIEQIPIKDKAHLRRFFQTVIDQGGEGIVIRDPQAPYIKQRTPRALKYKPFHDAECTVVGYKQGKGRLEGLVGALECQTEDEKHFYIGSGLSDKERKTPPKIGARVTYRYQGLTKYGKPRFPVFVRLREEE